MRFAYGILIVSILASCAPSPSARNEAFEAALSSIDERLDTASIEDYILALPPFAFHEESAEQFAASVRQARTLMDENKGKGPDYLFVGCDGCWPAKDFTLNRKTKSLDIRVYNWEPPHENTISLLSMGYGWRRHVRCGRPVLSIF